MRASIVLIAVLKGSHAFLLHSKGLPFVCTKSQQLQRRTRPKLRARDDVNAYSGGGEETIEEFDMEFDVNKLDEFNDLISDVKQKGYVSVGSNMIYDCTHGQWLLMQVAYDRKLKLFSSKRAPVLNELDAMVPEGAELIFSGVLQPKQFKRLLKVKNLNSIVVPNVDLAVELDAAMSEERQRLQDKSLSKVSRSRERYLINGGEDGESRAASPVSQFAEELKVYLRITEESTIEDTVEAVNDMRKRCPAVQLLGLWGGSGQEAYELLQGVKAETGLARLKVVIPYEGAAPSNKWFQGLTEGRGSVIWTFQYE